MRAPARYMLCVRHAAGIDASRGDAHKGSCPS